MSVLVDTCGWIEWLTDGLLAGKFGPHLRKPEQVVVPTSIQFELYKWVCRERDETLALEILGLTQQGKVRPLTTELAVTAAEVAALHQLAFADAIVYATARAENCALVTSDAAFDGLPGVTYYRKKA